jgi:hypothetical protein
MNVLVSIGCDTYLTLPTLHGAERDAKEVFETLVVEKGDYDPSLSRLILSPNVQAVKDVLDGAFPHAREIDLFTFFFAGHGEAKAGSFYLCTRESDSERLSTTAFPIVSLFSIVNEFHPRQVNIIIDACRAGASSFDLNQLQKPEIIGSSDASSITFLGACSSDEYASETPNGGVMTEQFVKCLNGEVEIQTKSPFLDLLEVGTVVCQKVRQISSSQKPILWGLSLFGDGRLAPNPHFDGGAIERIFPVNSVRPQSKIGQRIRDSSSILWNEYRAITEEFSARRLLSVLECIFLGATDDIPGMISFLQGLQRTLAAKAGDSSDLLAPSQCLATCALCMLRHLDSPLAKQYSRGVLQEILERDGIVWQQLVASIHAEEFALCDNTGSIAELYYLPLRITKTLGWIGLGSIVETIFPELATQHNDARFELASLMFDRYESSFVAVSDSQAPFLYVFLKACLIKNKVELAERAANLYYGSFAGKSGNIARVETAGATAFTYIRSLGPAEHRPKEWRPANPTSLLTVLLLFGEKLGLHSSWDLQAIDRKSTVFFIPVDYRDFADKVIEHGMNYTNQIGFGIWNALEFKTEFERGMNASFPLSASDLPKEGVGLCTIASLLFPDRLPLILERAM